MNRKKLIIALIILNLLLVGTATTLSAYKSHASGDFELEIAKIIFNNKETTSATISLKGMNPGDTKELSFAVSNNGIISHNNQVDASIYANAQIGDEIAIGDEHFYVISNNNGHITALAKYNLLVGNEADNNTGEITPLEYPTGIQSPDARGYVEGTDKFIGTVVFSNRNGWSYANNDDININNYIGPVRTALYDATYGYEKYLQRTVPTATVRLITLAELEGLGFSSANGTYEGVPVWVYSTSYWSGSAYAGDGRYVWGVLSNGSLGYSAFNIGYGLGVRPVVEFDIQPSFKIVNDLNYNATLDIGDEFAIGSEHFYVLSNNNSQIKALAKHGLNVSDGGEWSALVPDAQVGIQNELVDGHTYGAVLPFYYENLPELISGTIDFRNYLGPINTALYGENGYESYLQNTIPGLTTRLINSEELTSLGCLQENDFYSCNDSFSWVYDSYYWTSLERTPYNIWYVAPSRLGDGATFDCAYAVRPVIEFNMANVPNSTSSDNQVNVRSEVTVEYTLTVSTYYNVPYQIEIINSNNQSVLTCNDSTGTYDASGILSCTTETMTLGYMNDQTDNYRIVIRVPNGIDYEYSGQADFVTIDISSKQKVTS